MTLVHPTGLRMFCALAAPALVAAPASAQVPVISIEVLQTQADAACLSAVDVNADGIPDLTTVTDDWIIVHRSDGGGVFSQVSTRISLSPVVTCFALGPLTGGPTPSAVVLQVTPDLPPPNTESYFVYGPDPAQPGGFLFPSAFTSTFEFNHVPQEVVTADFDGDGTEDFVVTDDENLYVFRLVGGIPPVAPDGYPIPGGADYHGLVVGSLGGGPDPDVALTRRDANELRVYLNQGGGTGGLVLNASLSTEVRPVGLVAADVAGTALTDLIVANEGDPPVPGSVQIFERIGARFVLRETIGLVDDPVRGLAAADFDDDGDIDLAVSSQTQTVLLFNNGAAIAPNFDTSMVLGGASDWVEAGDFDDDGNPDAAFLDESTGDITVVSLDPDAALFIRGDADGNGVFNAILDGFFLLNFGFAGGAPPPCMDAADADDDGVVNGLVDGLYVLNFGFVPGSMPPPPPFPNCGPDPTADALDCVSPPPCP